MAQILVRNLDPSVVEKLKQQAKLKNRSLQAEAKEILEQQVKQLSMDEAIERIEQVRKSLGNRKFSDSTKIVRKERDR